MGVISRYFDRLAALLRPRRNLPPAVSADAYGLRIGGEQVAWSDVLRMDACKRDIYVGDVLCLAILSTSGQLFEISEKSPGWTEAADAIERFLPGSLPHAEWALRLIAGNPGESVAIYPAPRSGQVGQGL